MKVNVKFGKEIKKTIKFDTTTMKIFESFNFSIRQQEVAQQKETTITKSLQTIVKKLNQLQ